MIEPKPPRMTVRKAVASTAVHFADAAEYPTFRVITAMRRNTLLDRVPAVLPVTPEHHLPSVAQMRQHFRDLLFPFPILGHPLLRHVSPVGRRV